jgi:uncharacterized glyoxalase superfamily protein PhnB
MEPRISIITLGVKNFDRALRFYRDGLGFATTAKEGNAIAFFQTSGTRLALYPLERLAEDISPTLKPAAPSGFGGITLAHNARTKDEVGLVLALAEKAGATIVKPAHATFWGGYGGYFSDLEGYYWEVAWGPMFSFDDRGALII